MARGDAVQQKPTVEQEMAKFKGFSTTDGETSSGEPTPHEKHVLEANSKKIVAKPAAEMTPAEKSEAAAAAARTPKPKAAATGPTGPTGATGPTAATEAEPGEDEENEHEGESAEEKLAREVAEKAAKPPKKTAQQRINELTRQKREAERRADRVEGAVSALSAEVAALRAGKAAPLTPGKEGATQEPEGPPDPKKFQFGELDSAYIRALARYEVKNEIKGQTAEAAKSHQTAAKAAEVEANKTKFVALQEAGASKYDDFHEVVVEGARNNDYRLSPTLAKLSLESPVGADILYHLASHPKEAREVFGRSPEAQAAYFGRQEARFTPPSSGAETENEQTTAEGHTATTVKTTKAPPPVQQARGTGASNQVSPDTNDFAAFEVMAMRRK